MIYENVEVKPHVLTCVSKDEEFMIEAGNGEDDQDDEADEA